MGLGHILVIAAATFLTSNTSVQGQTFYVPFDPYARFRQLSYPAPEAVTEQPELPIDPPVTTEQPPVIPHRYFPFGSYYYFQSSGQKPSAVYSSNPYHVDNALNYLYRSNSYATKSPRTDNALSYLYNRPQTAFGYGHATDSTHLPYVGHTGEPECYLTEDPSDPRRYYDRHGDLKYCAYSLVFDPITCQCVHPDDLFPETTTPSIDIMTTTPDVIMTTTPPDVMTTTPPDGMTTTPPDVMTTTPTDVMTTTPADVMSTTEQGQTVDTNDTVVGCPFTADPSNPSQFIFDGFVVSCAPPSFVFSQEMCMCIDPNAQQTTPAPVQTTPPEVCDRTPVADNLNQFIDSMGILQTCADPLIFNIATCTCTMNNIPTVTTPAPPPDTTTDSEVCDLRPDPTDPRRYVSADGTIVYCPYGLFFSVTDCTCVFSNPYDQPSHHGGYGSNPQPSPHAGPHGNPQYGSPASPPANPYASLHGGSQYRPPVNYDVGPPRNPNYGPPARNDAGPHGGPNYGPPAGYDGRPHRQGPKEPPPNYDAGPHGGPNYGPPARYDDGPQYGPPANIDESPQYGPPVGYDEGPHGNPPYGPNVDHGAIYRPNPYANPYGHPPPRPHERPQYHMGPL